MLPADIKAEVERRRAEAQKSGMSAAEIAAGEREFAALPEAEQRTALGMDEPVVAPAAPPIPASPVKPQVSGGAIGQPREKSFREKLEEYMTSVGEGIGRGSGSSPAPLTTDDMKGMARAGLKTASGGATEAVNSAVQGAPAQAAGEITAAELSQMTPEQLEQLYHEANPEGAGQDIYARRPAGWVPGQRSEGSAAAGPDPEAVRASLGLQDQADAHALVSQEQRQEAARKREQSTLEVQQNEANAILELKKEQDAAASVAAEQRKAQLTKLQSIQKAMDAVPDAPRTIRAKLDRSGLGEKITFGLAAAMSVLGGAARRRGDESVRSFLGIVQANIDREVQKEADEYARHGERSKMAQNVYAAIRQGAEDDRAALEMTRAMYYDAAINATKQIATQYKLDDQSPQVQDLLEHLNRQRAEAVLKSAMRVEEQSSQTDRFDPGGVVKIGTTKPKVQLDSEGLSGALNNYGKIVEDRGGNAAERSIGLYQRVISSMQGADMDRKDKFTKAYIAMMSGEPTYLGKASQLYVQSLDDQDQKILQDLVQAGAEQMKDESGRSVTANELARDIVKKGAFSIASLDRVRDQVIQKRTNIYNTADAQAGGPNNVVGRTYRARKQVSQLTTPNRGIGGTPRQAIDPDEVGRKVGRLSGG